MRFKPKFKNQVQVHSMRIGIIEVSPIKSENCLNSKQYSTMIYTIIDRMISVYKNISVLPYFFDLLQISSPALVRDPLISCIRSVQGPDLKQKSLHSVYCVCDVCARARVQTSCVHAIYNSQPSTSKGRGRGKRRGRSCNWCYL